MKIEYPLYLVPLEAGYASVVEHTSDDASSYYLAVFTELELAETFMRQCGLEGEPRPLHNGRELAWLAHNLRAPITNVAFDPLAESDNVQARWKVAIDEMLKEHLVIDYSPWNYPVFVIQQLGGYASVEGKTGGGGEMRAIGLFTTREKAEAYLQETGETGTIEQLNDVPQTRAFLQHITPDAAAVALNLNVRGGQRSAKYCFSIRTVLDKYLVESRGTA